MIVAIGTETREEECMTLTRGLFSSNTDEWATPPALFNQLDREFHFTIDVCATADNAKVPRYYTPEDDGLAQDWTGEVCWLNPPYGREIPKWTRKARETAERGGLVVALVPARTDTRWWGGDVMKATEIRFIKGRVRFGGAGAGAPFPSAIVVWGTPRVPTISIMDQEGSA